MICISKEVQLCMVYMELLGTNVDIFQKEHYSFFSMMMDETQGVQKLFVCACKRDQTIFLEHLVFQVICSSLCLELRAGIWPLSQRNGIRQYCNFELIYVTANKYLFTLFTYSHLINANPSTHDALFFLYFLLSSLHRIGVTGTLTTLLYTSIGPWW